MKNNNNIFWLVLALLVVILLAVGWYYLSSRTEENLAMAASGQGPGGDTQYIGLESRGEGYLELLKEEHKLFERLRKEIGNDPSIELMNPNLDKKIEDSLKKYVLDEINKNSGSLKLANQVATQEDLVAINKSINNVIRDLDVIRRAHNTLVDRFVKLANKLEQSCRNAFPPGSSVCDGCSIK